MSVPFPSGVNPTLVFTDTFVEGALDQSVWKVYDGPGNAGIGLRSAAAVTLSAGRLVITASDQGGEIVSGGVAMRAGQTYGRWQVRVRTEPDPSGCTSGVALLWPDSENWPTDGETDFYETLGNPTRSQITATVHYGASDLMDHYAETVDATRWHEITLDWTADEIAIYCDGRQFAACTNPAAIPHVDQHLCLQLDAVKPGALGAPVRMLVDHVRVWTF